MTVVVTLMLLRGMFVLQCQHWNPNARKFYCLTSLGIVTTYEQYVISRYRVCLRALRSYVSVLHSHAAQCDTGADSNN